MTGPLSLNTATIAEKDVFAQIAVAARAGYDAIGLWISDLLQSELRHNRRGAPRPGVTPPPGGPSGDFLTAVRAAVDEAGLAVNELSFVKLATSAGRTLDDITRAVDEGARIAAALECPLLVATVAAAPGEEDVTARQLGELSALAASRGVRIAVEFSAGALRYNSLERTLPLVDDGGALILLDTFHFFVGDSSLDSLSALDPGRIGLIHISDAEKHSIRRLREVKHDLRTYPGDGFLPIVPFLKALEMIRYRSSISLEIWNGRIHGEESDAVATRARNALRRLLDDVLS